MKIKQSKFKPTAEQIEIIKQFANKIDLKSIVKKLMEVDDSYRITSQNVIIQMQKLNIPNTFYMKKNNLTPTDEQLNYIRNGLKENVTLREMQEHLNITEYRIRQWIKMYNLYSDSDVIPSGKTHGKSRNEGNNGYFNVNQYTCWFTGGTYRYH